MFIMATVAGTMVCLAAGMWEKCLSVQGQSVITCGGNVNVGCSGVCYGSVTLPTGVICRQCYSFYLWYCPPLEPYTVTATANVGSCDPVGYRGQCICQWPDPPMTRPVVITCNC